MRIFYDISRILNRIESPTPTGIDRVDIKYLYHFLHNDNYCVNFVILVGGVFYFCEKNKTIKVINYIHGKWIEGRDGSYKDFGLNRDQIISRVLLKGGINSALNKVDSYLLEEIAKNAKSPGYYLNCSHHGIGQVEAYFSFKNLGNLKIAFYLHDIIPVDYPEYVKEGDEVTHQKRVDVMANFSDLILVNSKYTRDRFLDNCSLKGNNIPPVHVQYIGVEDSFKSIGVEEVPNDLACRLSNNYLIYVGTIEPRKNHLMLLNLWRQYFQNMKDAPMLVLLGKRGWNNQAVFDLLDRTPALKASIVEVHGVSDGLMVSLVKKSKGVLFPTFVEGWGMPLVEAMTMHVPVLAADIPALREAGQGMAEYIDPMNAPAWRDAILKLCHDTSYSCKLIERNKKYQPPAWSDTFSILDEVLRSSIAHTKEREEAETSLRLRQYKKSLEERKMELNESSKKSNAIDTIGNVVVDRMSSSSRKKLRKFINNPKAFFMDSQKPMLNKIGNFIKKI